MQDNEQSTFVQQFRTVVMGYRLHGQLFNSSSSQQVFSLKITSSTNKEENYQLTFDQANLIYYKFVQQFSTPQTLYEHLSKMTKLKIRFNSELKSLAILYDKEKLAHQLPIELLSNIQAQVQFDKREIETTFSEQKEQYFDENINQKSEQKQQKLKNQAQEITEINKKETTNETQTLQETQQTNTKTQQPKDIQNIEQKIQQFRNFFQMDKPKQLDSKPVRQVKPINYNFTRSESQPHTLYEFALNFKVQSLADMIESEQLDKVEEIVLKRTRLPEIPPFNQIDLQNLKFLSLEENKLTKIINLEKMPNLQKLNLDGNKISIIENLSHLANLKILKLGNNDIQAISGLDKLVNIQTLWLDFNSIQKIQGLNGLNKLKALNISFNLIKKIQNLDHLSNLQQLLLNQNQITKIQNLDKLLKLTKLSLSMNSIQKVKGLKKLLFLEVVYLNENQIEEFDKVAFEEFNWLKMLKDVKLNANYIEWTEESRGFVTRLKNYGVKVSI